MTQAVHMMHKHSQLHFCTEQNGYQHSPLKKIIQMKTKLREIQIM